jgi:hypothetical protein
MGFKIQFLLELEAEISNFSIHNMKNTTSDKGSLLDGGFSEMEIALVWVHKV